MPSDHIHIMFDFTFELQRHQGENNTHIHSSWMRDVFPTKCTKSSSCNPFNWPSWISWWRCSWYTGVSAVVSLWSLFFRLFSTEGFRISGAILQSPVVWHHAYASVQPKLVTKHISTTFSARIWWHKTSGYVQMWIYIIYMTIYYILNQHFIVQTSHISYYFTRYVQEGHPMVNAHQTCWLLW